MGAFLHIWVDFRHSIHEKDARLYICEPDGSRGVFLRRLNTDDFASETEKHPKYALSVFFVDSASACAGQGTECEVLQKETVAHIFGSPV